MRRRPRPRLPGPPAKRLVPVAKTTRYRMDLDQLQDALRLENGRLWLLIGLCLATIYTLQAVEEAVEGAWPHLRRPTRLPRQARAVNAAWPWVALLVLPGLLL